MKKLIAILSISSLPLFAQDTTAVEPFLTNKHEIGADISPIFSAVFRSTGLPGIYYRRHYKKGSLRLKISAINGSLFNTSTSNSTSQSGSTSYSDNSNSNNPRNTLGIGLSIGYQYNKDFEKFRIYGAWDVRYSYSSFSQTSVRNSNQDQTGNTSGFYDNSTIRETKLKDESITMNNSIEFLPTFGCTYKFNDRFTLSAETSMSFGYNFNQTKTSSSEFRENNSNSGLNTNLRNSSSTSDGSGFGFNFIPLSSFIVGYHF